MSRIEPGGNDRENLEGHELEFKGKIFRRGVQVRLSETGRGKIRSSLLDDIPNYRCEVVGVDPVRRKIIVSPTDKASLIQDLSGFHKGKYEEFDPEDLIIE